MAQLSDFHGRHYGEVMVVCGLGKSLNEFRNPQRFTTIGVNDIGRAFTPTYLFVMDSPESFGPERFRYIADSRAKVVFTDHELKLERRNVVRFPIRQNPVPRFDDPRALYHIGRPPTSPFLALCLAAHMGAKAIGLIGVDFQDGHFFAKDGPHRLVSGLRGIDRRFYRLGSALLARGVKIFNLSTVSRLTAFPSISETELKEVQRRGISRSWSRPAIRVVLRSSRAAGAEIVRIAATINQLTLVSCRLIAPESPDLKPGSDLEKSVLADASVVFDCATTPLPPYRPESDGPFLRYWNDRLKPVLFRSYRTRVSASARRRHRMHVIVSQEQVTPDEVADTLRSILPELLRDDALIVIARHGQSEKMPHWIRCSRRMRLVEQGPMESWSRARNRVAGSARQDLLVFVGGNIEAPERWPDRLMAGFRVRRASAVGAAIVDMYEERAAGYGLKWSGDCLKATWLPFSGEAPREVPLLSGKFWAIRRAVFSALEGFDPKMRGSGVEDWDMCMRIRGHGGKCIVQPNLEVRWVNPCASGAISKHKIATDFLHDLVLLAVRHLPREELVAFLAARSGSPIFRTACARAVGLCGG